MRDPMRNIMIFVFLIAAILAGLLLFGPREPVNLSAGRDPQVGPDPEAFIAAQEAEFALVPGTDKTIVWADPATKAKTAMSVVYIHGFSSSRMELHPVPERVSEALGANLFLTRLTGHGLQDPNQIAEATVADWMRDTGEALEIGRMLGERVLLIGTSHGGALSALAVFDVAMARDVAGVVLVSPNFKIAASGSDFLTVPFARQLVPEILGPTRSWTPVNKDHAALWTTSYPSTALLPVAATARAAAQLPFERAIRPALFIYSPQDQVVDARSIAAAANAWGQPVDALRIMPGDGVDPAAHVVAGDILSPSQTAPVTARIVTWAEAL